MKLFGFNITRNKERRSMDDLIVYNPYSSVLPFGNSKLNTSAMCLSAVFRATEMISDNIAILPIKVTNSDKEHFESIDNHPLTFTFSNGIDTITKYTFMKLLIQSVILKGNGYALIEREMGQTRLRFIEHNDVTISYDKYHPEKLYYTITGISGKILPKDLIHLVKNSWNGVEGVSLLNYAKRSLGIANDTEDSAKSFFNSGCNLAGIINVQGQLTEKQKQEIKANWTQAYNGTNTNGCLLGVLQGNMTYQPIQSKAVDSQMLESRQFNVQDIARFFGISPILLGDLSNSSYNTLESAQQEFILHTLKPYITMVEDEFSRKLLDDSNLRIELDETVILKTDKTAMAQYYSTLIDKGILCINEVRNELGYSKIEGGDKHIIPFTDINMNTINNKDKETDDDTTQGTDRT